MVTFGDPYKDTPLPGDLENRRKTFCDTADYLCGATILLPIPPNGYYAAVCISPEPHRISGLSDTARSSRTFPRLRRLLRPGFNICKRYAFPKLLQSIRDSRSIWHSIPAIFTHSVEVVIAGEEILNYIAFICFKV